MPLEIILSNFCILLFRIDIRDIHLAHVHLLPVNVAPHDELPPTELYPGIRLTVVIHNAWCEIHCNTQCLPPRCEGDQLKIVDHHSAVELDKLCEVRHQV